MTDLLTPEEVKAIETSKHLWRHVMGDVVYSVATVHRLCRDYLTLWANVEELRDDLADVREELEESCR